MNGNWLGGSTWQDVLRKEGHLGSVRLCTRGEMGLEFQKNLLTYYEDGPTVSHYQLIDTLVVSLDTLTLMLSRSLRVLFARLLTMAKHYTILLLDIERI